MRHLFVLGPGVMYASSEEEVRATALGLREVGLFHMPYDRDVFLEIPAQDCVGPDVNPDHAIIYGPFGVGQEVGTVIRDVKLDRTYHEHWDRFGEQEEVEILKSLLIVLLATKNAHKQTVVSKLAKLGIGKSHKNRFATTTTISLPGTLPNDEQNPPKGAKVAPHLRRGHVRRQHHGAGNEQVKVIWIEPVFVNADPDFVATRTRYRISAGGTRGLA